MNGATIPGFPGKIFARCVAPRYIATCVAIPTEVNYCGVNYLGTGFHGINYAEHMKLKLNIHVVIYIRTEFPKAR